jgi:hypothetical protein
MEPMPVVEDLSYRLLPGGARIVNGELFNPGSKLIPNAQIEVSLFDADNRRVSTMSILVKNIPPGERVSFREAVQTDQDVQGARVRTVLVL